MPNKGKKPSRRRQSGRGRSSGSKGILDALRELKIATAIGPTPRVLDVPRLVLRTPCIVTMAQTYSYGTVSFGTSPSSGAINFQLTNLPNVGSMTTLFDAYRFIQATVRFVPMVTLPLGTTATPLLTVIDRDDSTPLGSFGAAYQYDTLMETPFGHYVERTLKPQFNVVGAPSTSNLNVAGKGWVDCSSTVLPWYGVKYYQFNTTASTGNAYSVEVDLVLQLAYVR
jgi:hypothetical protein